MLKKTYTFALLAAALIITPNAAFAQSYQNSIQNIEQNAVAEGNGNVVVNTATQQSFQNRRNLGNRRFCSGINNSQAQSSTQNIIQNAVAIGNSNTVVNTGSQLNVQKLLSRANSYYCY